MKTSMSQSGAEGSGSSYRGLRAATVAAVLLCLPSPLAAQAVVVANASIIDASAPDPVRVGSIVVENGRITAVGVSPPVPDGAVTIDARGKFVVPGLWDMHAHLAALTPVGRAPERYVGHGVLNVRDMGGHTDILFPLRAAIRGGARTGPEIVLAGPTLNSEQPAPFHRKVTNAAEARAAVRELKAAGVDLIKVHRATNREAFEAIADETKRLRLAFAGHVPLVMGWIEGSNAGMRSIEHIQTIFENIQPDPSLIPAQFDSIVNRLNGSLSESIFAVMKANRTFFDPTLVGYEASIGNATPVVAERRKFAYEKMKAIAAQAAKAGVPIITGTDVLERHGEMLLKELERLVDIGLSAKDVLAAATVTSAEAAERPELGRVTVGAPASFVILEANPLDDITNLRTISAVVLRKQVLGADELAKLRQ
jgi:imidazolonepropionase-like amidohydrolase